MKTLAPLAALGSAVVILAACGDNHTTNPPPDGSIQLSSAQATAIRARVGQLAASTPELAWLADSIQLIVGTGVEAAEVPITTSLGAGPFYAVSLQRTITTSFSASAAFDVVLFNDPSNPTDFIIASGWTNPGGNSSPPVSVSGSFGAPTATSTVNAHFFEISGSSVNAWRAVAGTADFALGDGPAGSCSTVEDGPDVTCNPAMLNVSFSVSDAQPEVGGAAGTKSASLEASVVSGIIIHMVIH